MPTMTTRTVACSCSLSVRPLKRRRTRSRPRRRAPAGGLFIAAGSDMLGVLDAAFGRQIDADRRSAADGAADIEGAAMQARQLDGERQPEARAGMGDEGRFVDAPEPRLGRGNILLGDAHARIGDDETKPAGLVDAGDHRYAAARPRGL